MVLHGSPTATLLYVQYFSICIRNLEKYKIVRFRFLAGKRDNFKARVDFKMQKRPFFIAAYLGFTIQSTKAQLCIAAFSYYRKRAERFKRYRAALMGATKYLISKIRAPSLALKRQ